MPTERPDPFREPVRAGAPAACAYAGAALEDVALWHERDISPLAVERVSAGCHGIADFMVATAAHL